MTGDKMNELIKQRIAAVRRGEVPEGYQQINGYIIPRNWHLEPLSNKFKRSFRKNDSACDNVLTISAQLGLVSQKEYYDKDIASEDKSGYYLLKKGEFAYNKSYSTGYPFGAIKRLEKYETGIVSPLYICFTPLEETNASFYAQYFEAGLYNREIYRFAQEGARNHGLLNISTEDFFAGDLAVPPEEEQRKISEILSACDRGIALKQELVRELQRLKKTCLAKLFPRNGSNIPELRFPGFTDPWEERKLVDLSDYITKGATPTTYGFEWVDEGIPFFRNDAIKDNQFIYGDYSYISEEANEAIKRSEITGDDILVAITGDIGKVGIVPRSIKKANINQHTARVRIIRGAIPFFVFQSLATEKQQNEYKKIKTGISMPQLSLEQIRETKILCPSIEEQSRIADMLTQFNNLITLHQRELEEEQRKKKAMMQLLLTGIVRV